MKNAYKKLRIISRIILIIFTLFTLLVVASIISSKNTNSATIEYSYVSIDDACTTKNTYKVQMYYNDTYPESKCVFTEKEAKDDDSVMVYEDEGNKPGTMIGVYDLIDNVIINETTYSREGIYIGLYDSYKKQKTVWIQFLKCKG